jgi:hypothetical protein
MSDAGEIIPGEDHQKWWIFFSWIEGKIRPKKPGLISPAAE